MPSSLGSWRPSASTWAPAPPRRQPSRSAPRSSPSAPVPPPPAFARPPALSTDDRGGRGPRGRRRQRASPRPVGSTPSRWPPCRVGRWWTTCSSAVTAAGFDEVMRDRGSRRPGRPCGDRSPCAAQPRLGGRDRHVAAGGGRPRPGRGSRRHRRRTGRPARCHRSRPGGPCGPRPTRHRSRSPPTTGAAAQPRPAGGVGLGPAARHGRRGGAGADAREDATWCGRYRAPASPGTSTPWRTSTDGADQRLPGGAARREGVGGAHRPRAHRAVHARRTAPGGRGRRVPRAS